MAAGADDIDRAGKLSVLGASARLDYSRNGGAGLLQVYGQVDRASPTPTAPLQFLGVCLD